MDIVIRIALVILALYILGKINYVIHVQMRKRARDVEMDMVLAFDGLAKSHFISLAAPFYDEKPGFYLGLSIRGLHFGFTPKESMHAVLKEVFKDKSIAQTCFDLYEYPDMRRAQGIVTEMRQDGVELLNGALIYNPDAIEKGCLEYGITNSLDRYLIYPSNDFSAKYEFQRNIDKLRKIRGFDAIDREKAIFNSEGEIIKLFEVWNFFHRDKDIILNFANAVLHKGIEKLFKLNTIDFPDDFSFPFLEKIFPGIDDFSHQRDILKLYFDNDNFVIYRERGKKYDTFTVKTGKRPPRGKFHKFLSKFIPEMASPRAYSKESLRSMGFKLIKAAGLMAAGALGLAYIMNEILNRESMIMIVIVGTLSLFCVGSLVIGLYYILLGLFGRRKFIRIGI